jgi:hypothetical protein
MAPSRPVEFAARANLPIVDPPGSRAAGEATRAVSCAAFGVGSISHKAFRRVV